VIKPGFFLLPMHDK